MNTEDLSANAIPDRRDDLVGELIRNAGRREVPPAGMRNEVLAETHRFWREQVRRRRRRFVAGIAAALALVSVVATIYAIRITTPSAQLARVARVVGVLETRPAVDMAWQSVGERDQVLNRGQHLRTGARSRANILLAGNVSLRLDHQTEITLTGPGQIELRDGMLYVDTGSRSTDVAGVEIITPAGIARDIGTQFEVRYLEDDFRLRVREGRVSLRRGSEELLSASGDQLAVGPTGDVTAGRTAVTGPSWSWVQTVALVPDIDNQPLTMLLEWVARETGRPVRYQSPALESKAEMTILHGKVRDLGPMDVLGIVLATTDFTYEELDDGAIMIRLRYD